MKNVERLSATQDEPAESQAAGEQREDERVILGETSDGFKVYDRPDSHFHSEGGLTFEILGEAISRIDTDGRPFVRERVEFDHQIGETTCVDVTPDDDIVMVRRKGRSGLTPMVKNRNSIPCNSVIVILAKNPPSDGEESFTLITSFIGDLSPREPWDPNIDTEDELRQCEEYWATHALIYDESLIDQEQTGEYDSMADPEKRVERIRSRVLYDGAFVDKDELYGRVQPTLDNIVEHPHITTTFRPETEQLRLPQVGTSVKIYAVGYGNNGRNEGLLVKAVSDDPVIQEALDAIEVPHITLSYAQGAHPKDTSSLEFEPLDEPFEITGTYGLFTQGETILSQAELDEYKA